MISFTGRMRGAVKRERAERYLLLMLLSFATSVTGTRLFLELTGYPQVGSSELHIAHVLWGGLLLFIAALLPLIFANRWVYAIGALAGGVGAGLFIDEVGKFITRSNDYFYPFAAPIIYGFFLLTVLIYLSVRRESTPDARTELYRALDGLMEVLDYDLDPGERADLEARLARVVTQGDPPDHAHLASALLAFVRSDAIQVVPKRPAWWERLRSRALAFEARWLTRRRMRIILVTGMGLLGTLASLQLFVSLLALFFPDVLEAIALELLTTEQLVQGAASLAWYLVRLTLEGMLGLMMSVGAILMLWGYERPGYTLGYYGLLLALTMVNLLVFYFDQFGTIALSMVEFALLMGLLRYRQRYLDRPESSR